jgi:hypothetical protein
LVVDPVEELRQINVHQPNVASRQIPPDIGQGRLRASPGTEAMAAFMKPGIEDRLQNLVHGLLNPPVHDIRNSKPPLAATSFGYPNPADVSRDVGFLQQGSAKTGKEGPSMPDHFSHRFAIHSGRTFVARDVQ